jgi:hypothetical protein
VGVALLGALQVAPHFRQFEVSLARSTQEPLHPVSVPQSLEHAPALHTLPLSQAVAQSPQCWPSARMSTQAPPQSVYPLLQSIPHLPDTQVGEPLLGIGHLVSQAPQLEVSESSLTQLSPQGA